MKDGQTDNLAHCQPGLPSTVCQDYKDLIGNGRKCSLLAEENNGYEGACQNRNADLSDANLPQNTGKKKTL